MTTTIPTQPDRYVLQVRPEGAGPFLWPHEYACDLQPEAASDAAIRLVVARGIVSFRWGSIVPFYREELLQLPGPELEEEEDQEDEEAEDEEEDEAEDDPPPRIWTSGWTEGLDLACSVPWEDIGELIEAWFGLQEGEPWSWQLRMVLVTA